MKRGGSVMSARLRKQVSANPEYQRCALQGLHYDLIGPCAGRVTREHALYFQGQKVQEEYAIPPICEKHHGVGLWLDAKEGVAPKDMRVWVAVNRATDEELISISKVVKYLRERVRLNDKYGAYVPPRII